MKRYCLMGLRVAFILFIFSLFSDILYGQQLYFHRLTVDDGLPHNTVNSFIQDNNGFMWIVSSEGLCRFDGYQIKTYYSDKSRYSPVNNRPALLALDSNNDVWISFFTTTQVCKYNVDTDNFTRCELSQLEQPLQNALNFSINTPTLKHVESSEFTWDIINNLLVQTNNQTGEKYVYSGDTSEQGGLFDSYVLSLYLDNNDVLWVGTENGGVHYADINRKKFNHYIFEFDGSDFLADNFVRTIYEDKQGFLWVGTRNNGMIRMFPGRTRYEYFNYYSPTTATIEDKRVRSVYQDSRGLIWIGTQHGVYRYNDQTNDIRHYTTETDDAMADNFVYTINEDAYGVLWIGTWKGVLSYNPETERFTSYNADKTKVYTSVRCIVKGKDGGLWVATENGLTFMNYQIKDHVAVDIQATYYHCQENVPYSLNDDYLYALDVDDDGNPWIGTAKGLNMYDIRQGRFVRFDDIEYLSNTLIRGVVCSRDDVWISHRNGLTRLNRKKMTVRHFDKSDGLQGTEFSEDAYHKNLCTGELFFGGNNGLNAFFSDDIHDNSCPPKVVFTALKMQNKTVEVGQKINGKVILQYPITRTRQIVLNHTNKEFEIVFSALHYANPSKNRYAYMLQGFDNTWQYANAARRSVIYSGLPAGKYTLKVKGSNCDGVWSDEPIEMQITILSPWWATKVAYAIYFLLFLSICFIIFKDMLARKNLKHRIQLEQVKAEKAEEISRLRSTFFTGISHELRSPVTLIIDPLRKLMDYEDTPCETSRIYHLMYRNAQRLLNLINQLLDFRRLESSKQELQLHESDIVLFVRKTMAMFEIATQKKNIQLILDTPFENYLLVFDSNVLDKVLVNLLSNAVKYSSENTIITVKLISGAWFTIQITDQGMGIAPDMKEKIFDLFFRIDQQNIGSGIGLALTRELIHLHQGKINVESELGIGSTFTVLLPVDLQASGNDSYTNPITDSSPELILLQTEKDEETIEENGKVDPEKSLVLIVEDNGDIRNYIREDLADTYQIITAINGQEGLEKALETIPDLVVSDIMMPEMSGIELCDTLKKDERTSHIPVILLTAHQSDEVRMEGYESGADDYISKPFNVRLLRIRISNLIESRKKLRGLFGKATPMELKKISINPADEKFINRAVSIVHQYMADAHFTPDTFASEMAVSRSQLFRKIKAMTNQTVHEFIITIRLNYACELLLTAEYSIGEIAIMTGFSEASNFSRAFTRKFQETPSSYIKNHR